MKSITTPNIYKAIFSPTGGTAHAASLLADKLTGHFPASSVQTLDCTVPGTREISHSFDERDILIAAVPVYAGQLPPVENLFANLKGNKTPCIVMAAYGNRHYDDALAQLQNKLTNQGFVCIAGIACIIPHTFSEKVGANRPNAEDLKVIAEFADAFVQKYNAHDLSKAALPGNPAPEPKPRKSMPKFLDNTLCLNCKLCAKSCPVGAIDFSTLEINGDKCINCMRCSYVCPVKARTFNADAAKAMLETNCMNPRPIEIFL